MSPRPSAVEGAAFESFAADAAPRLIRAASVMLRDRGEAQDLVQETLIRMFQHWNRIADHEAAYLYAYRTLVRLSVRHRKRMRFRREFVTDVPPELIRTGAGTGQLPIDLDIEEALRMLPRGQLEVLVLRYICDASVESTSQALQCSVGTVKSQSSKGLTSLRRLLTERQSLTDQGDRSAH